MVFFLHKIVKMNETDDLADYEPGTPSQYGPDF